MVLDRSINSRKLDRQHDEIDRQQRSFDRNLSKLVSEYPHRYILFDNGLVVDADENPDVLLERIFATDFVKERTSKDGSGIYCYFIPERVEERTTKKYRDLQSDFSMKVWVKTSEIDRSECYSDSELAAYDRFYEGLLAGE